MKVVKSTTAEGKRLIDMAGRCLYSTLDQLYNRPSHAKQQAFDECWQEFRKDEESYNFGVGNANTFTFTACWQSFSYKYEQDVLIVKTAYNDYMVLLQS